ncbi:MAG: hypothetical protein U0S36_11710 [Candidatus Nanopelagicales bacterium]
MPEPTGGPPAATAQSAGPRDPRDERGPGGLARGELAALDALDLLGAHAAGSAALVADVLAVARRLHDVDEISALGALRDMGDPARRHLPLLELAADGLTARSTPVGELALASERGETGPLPLALVEGSLLRGGEVPPFSPDLVVGALLAGSAYAGSPALPGGGTVEGDVDALLRGEAVELVVGCALRDEVDRLVVTEVPGLTSAAAVLAAVNRALADDAAVRRPTGAGDVLRDESSALDGVRLVLDIERRSNVARVVDWLRAVEPVTLRVRARLPAPMPERLATWQRGDGTGLRALADLLAPPY